MEFSDSIEKISNYMKDEFGLDDEDVQEMLDEYFSNMSKVIGNIKRHLESGNWTEIKAAAHSIKGASANIGANQMSELARMLEDASKSDDSEASASYLSKLNEGLEILKSQAE